jgi:hypothetical protein
MAGVPGQVGFSQGYVADQTELLQIVVDGLGVYNMTADPIIDDFTEEIVMQESRVSQAPIQFNRHADGGAPDGQRQSYRLLNTPLNAYEAGTPFTVLGLQDALPSDVQATMNGVMAGDAERMEMEFFRCLFTPQTAGAVGTAYQASFWNGETDVPNWKNNTFFGTAHSHYAGLNTTTLALSHFQSMKKDIQQHGYGLTPGSLVCFLHSDQESALENLLNIAVSSSLTTPSRVVAQEDGAYGQEIRYSGIRFVINDNTPSGYIAMVDVNVKPIAKRVHLRPDYRGLQMYSETYNENYPLAGQNFLNRYGFAVRHLGAGTVRQLVASTSYTTPTFRLAA